MISARICGCLRGRQGHFRKSPVGPAGIAASAVTWRPASIMPSNDSTGTSTAATRAAGCRLRVPGPDPEPKMHADHRVRPGDDQGQHLPIAEIRRPNEIYPQHIRVITDIGMEEIVGDTRPDNVAGEQYRDRKAENDLGELSGRAAASSGAATVPTAPDRNGSETAIEQELRRPVRPDPEKIPQHIFHRLERDQADGMVEKMHRHIDEHHQARSKPQPSDHRGTRRRQHRGTKPLAIGAPVPLSGRRRAQLARGARAGKRRKSALMLNSLPQT